MPSYSLSTTLNRKRQTISKRKFFFSTSQARRRRIFSSPVNHSANEKTVSPQLMKSHTLNSQCPPMNSLFTTALSALPFLYKKHFSPLFPGLEQALPLDRMCQIAIVCCCRIKSFCDRNIWLSVCFRSAFFGVF